MEGMEINITAVFIAALCNVLIGALWFSPMLFGKIWMELSGITGQNVNSMKNKIVLSYLICALAAFVMSFVLSLAIQLYDAIDLLDAIKVGTLIWLGFIATTYIGIVLWEGKSIKLYLINTGYIFISLIMMSIIHFLLI